MFYNYDLLCTRAGGKFALIWLAATNKKLSFIEIMKVNVQESCNDIIEVVKLNAPETLPDNLRPRFSLYLSSMLMYGTCVILRRQCVIAIDQMMTWSRTILTLSSGPKVPLLQQEADDAEKKKGRKRKRTSTESDDSRRKTRLDVIPELSDPNVTPHALEINTNVLLQLNKASAVLPSSDLMQHMECNLQMQDVSTSALHDEIENILFAQERLGNEGLEDLTFKLPNISSPTNIQTVETHVTKELAESAAIDNVKDGIHAAENVQPINIHESSLDVNKEMQIEECHTSTEIKPLDSLPVLQQAVCYENIRVNVNHDELMQDGQISSTVILDPNNQQNGEPGTTKKEQPKRPLPKKTKHRKAMIFIDEETQISKDDLKALTQVLDLALRIQDPENELITTPKSDSFPYFQKLFSFNFADELTNFFSERSINYSKPNMAQTHSDMKSEIERGQKTPTGSPMDPLRMGRTSEIPADTTANMSKLHSISESNMEVQDIPLDHPLLLPENAAKLSEDTNLIPAEVPPVSLVEDRTLNKETTENVQSGIIDDRIVIPETPSSQEKCEPDSELVPKADEKLLDEQRSEKSERFSNAQRLREKVFKKLKKLLHLKNKIISFHDLCPYHSCTKQEAALTFKYLLELDLKKKIILHQGRKIPYDTIHIQVQ